MEYNDIIILVASLMAGYLLDKRFGDPTTLPHPIVGFGKVIAYGDKHLNTGSHKKLKGGLFSISLILSTFICSHLLLKQVYMLHPLLYFAIGSILIFYCLAGKTLIEEVRKVFVTTEQSTDQGRKQLSRIVGRDTSQLDKQQIRTAALETLSENLSDGVIAPLFWCAILGVPGMLTYKMVNTLDSMIGYKNDRFKQFGCCAARIDDLANYIPARLTAIIMILVTRKWHVASFITKYARRHASPNSGYPEAALAGILNGRFGGPNFYFGKLIDKPYIGYNPRPFTQADMHTAITINQNSEKVMLMLSCTYILMTHYI